MLGEKLFDIEDSSDKIERNFPQSILYLNKLRMYVKTQAQICAVVKYLIAVFMTLTTDSDERKQCIFRKFRN